MPWPNPVLKLRIFHNIVMIIFKELKANGNVIIHVTDVVFVSHRFLLIKT